MIAYVSLLTEWSLWNFRQFLHEMVSPDAGTENGPALRCKAEPRWVMEILIKILKLGKWMVTERVHKEN